MFKIVDEVNVVKWMPYNKCLRNKQLVYLTKDNSRAFFCSLHYELHIPLVSMTTSLKTGHRPEMEFRWLLLS